MKRNGLIIFSVLFFIVINTRYFWEGSIGFVAFPFFILLVLIYLILAILLLRQVYFLFKEKFAHNQRLIVVGLVSVILILVFMSPNGLIDFDKMQGDDLLIAEREGVANCTTVLKLKENNKFRERSVCFGIKEVSGNYELKGDTIFFKDVELSGREKSYYQFAVIEKVEFQNKKILAVLTRYINNNDTLGNKLWITTNKLK